jgi:hypothetical protein
MPISDWFDLMPAVVSVELVATRDAYGKPATYQTPQVFDHCRVNFKEKRIASKVPGQDTIAAGTIWLGGLIQGLGEGQADARITIPGGAHPKLIDFGGTPDENGDLYSTLYIGPV